MEFAFFVGLARDTNKVIERESQIISLKIES